MVALSLKVGLAPMHRAAFYSQDLLSPGVLSVRMNPL